MLKVTEIPEDLRQIDGAFIKDITSVNHKPHPYMIGGRHVSHAADKHGGMLGEATMRAIPCAWPRCRSGYDEHTHDTVAVIHVTKDTPKEAAQEWLKTLAAFITPKGVEGFVFVSDGGKFI